MKIYLLLLISPFFHFFLDTEESYLQEPDIGKSGTTEHVVSSQEDSAKGKENPVIPGDFADPSVIRKDSLYYASGTSSEWAPHYPLFQSTNLLNWHQIGYALLKTPAWASASFWAPELFYFRGTY